jgi:inositol transporter-like SP family MFS transporter
MSWGFGPMIILLLGMFFAPGGYLFGWVESIGHFIGGADLAGDALNVFSSRVVFFSLFVVAFIAWNMQRKLEESKEWTETRNAAKAKGEDRGLMQAFKLLFTNAKVVKTACFLAVIYLTWNLVASVMGFFQPHIYETAGGLTNEYANMLSCVGWVIVVVVTFGVSFFIDRVSHKLLYVLGLVAALATWFVVIAGVNGMGTLWLFSILWGINGGISVQIFYALWGSELFPAKFRAGAQGLMFFVVRGLSAAWGLAFTYIYGENGEGFTVAAYCMIALLLISLVVGVIGCPNTRGKSFDQITRERYGDDY